METMTLSQVKELQKHLINFGLVDPPVDGVLGRQTLKAVEIFATQFKIANEPLTVLEKIKTQTQKTIQPVNDFVKKTIQECFDRGFYLSRGVDAPNIVYIEGVNIDGVVNKNYINHWNDIRTHLIIEHNGKAYFKNIWEATVNSGQYYTNFPMNPGGAANIKIPLQAWAWKIGRHITSSANQDALIQVRPVPVLRDKNKDGRSSGDKIEDWDVIGLNQHYGYGDTVGRWSAGCLVVVGESAQDEFMDTNRTHRSYKIDPGYLFGTIVLDNNFLK